MSLGSSHPDMAKAVAMIGFGEAAAAFACGWATPQADLRTFDIATLGPDADAKRAEYALAGVRGCADAASALNGAEIVLSLVTADRALAAAETAAPHLVAGAFWCDMNSVAPDTKRAAAVVIEAGGGRYVDVAVMSPVHPAGAATPLLVSGPHAAGAAEMLRSIGFTRVDIVPGDVGRASSIKMIRSVMVKGIEALTAECVLAADAAGVLDEVLASLDASPLATRWHARADYNLGRMMVHGLRRAAEMAEAVKTLDALGASCVMTLAAVQWHQAIGEYGITPPPTGLLPRIAAIRSAAA